MTNNGRVGLYPLRRNTLNCPNLHMIATRITFRPKAGEFERNYARDGLVSMLISEKRWMSLRERCLIRLPGKSRTFTVPNRKIKPNLERQIGLDLFQDLNYFSGMCHNLPILFHTKYPEDFSNLLFKFIGPT